MITTDIKFKEKKVNQMKHSFNFKV